MPWAWITALSGPVLAKCTAPAGRWKKEPAGRTRPLDWSKTAPRPKPIQPEMTVMFSSWGWVWGGVVMFGATRSRTT